MSQLCGLWSIYTIFQHFNRCIFPASLFFNCKNQKKTHFGSLASFCRASASSIWVILGKRFLWAFLPPRFAGCGKTPKRAGWKFCVGFRPGRKRQTFRFRHETRIWEIQWNPFGIFLGRNSKRKVFVETHELGKTALPLNERLEVAFSGPMKLLLSVIKMPKDCIDPNAKPWRNFCVLKLSHIFFCFCDRSKDLSGDQVAKEKQRSDRSPAFGRNIWTTKTTLFSLPCLLSRSVSTVSSVFLESLSDSLRGVLSTQEPTLCQTANNTTTTTTTTTPTTNNNNNNNNNNTHQQHQQQQQQQQ